MVPPVFAGGAVVLPEVATRQKTLAVIEPGAFYPRLAHTYDRRPPELERVSGHIGHARQAPKVRGVGGIPNFTWGTSRCCNRAAVRRELRCSNPQRSASHDAKRSTCFAHCCDSLAQEVRWRIAPASASIHFPDDAPERLCGGRRAASRRATKGPSRFERTWLFPDA